MPGPNHRNHYMLVRKGRVQWMQARKLDGTPTRLWPIAETFEDAMLLTTWLKSPPDVRPEPVGGRQGETLEGLFDLAISEGCSAVCCVAGWDVKGAPIWKLIPLD